MLNRMLARVSSAGCRTVRSTALCDSADVHHDEGGGLFLYKYGEFAVFTERHTRKNLLMTYALMS